jgi:hypothetical protein
MRAARKPNRNNPIKESLKEEERMQAGSRQAVKFRRFTPTKRTMPFQWPAGNISEYVAGTKAQMQGPTVFCEDSSEGVDTAKSVIG